MSDDFKIVIVLKTPEGASSEEEVRGNILLDDKELQEFTLKSGTEEKFEHVVTLEDGDHKLIINNKYAPDNKLACIIDKIEFDDIDLGIIAYSGEYRPNYPEPWYTNECSEGRQPKEVWGGGKAGKDSFAGQDGSACLFMGWEGEYTLKFYTPLYEWLLEHL